MFVPVSVQITESRQPGRIGWIDMARGGAILLVVMGHVWRGLSEGGLIKNEALFQHVDQVIYLFHMPVFFILSGFVFRGRVQPSLSGFLTSRVVRILYPLLLWYYLFIGVNVLMSPYVNNPFSVERLLALPTPFGTQYWFLYALFVVQLLCMPIAFARTRQQIMGFVLIAGSAAVLSEYQFGFFNIWLNQAIAYLPFFLLGVLASEITNRDGLHRFAPAQCALWGVGIFILAQFLRQTGAPVPAPFLLLGVFASIGFILMILSVSLWSTHGRLTTALEILGRASMAIYLAHVFFTAFSRMALTAMGVQELWMHVLIGTTLGVSGPLILRFLADRFSLGWVLGFGR
jgi:fucose 4-O-acetylase-like acetyltransferase